jgi:hypothetical protein
MQGLPEMPIRNVVLKNVNVKEAGEKSFITYVVDMEWNNIVIGNKFSF